MHADSTVAGDRRLAEARALFERNDVGGAEALARSLVAAHPDREDAATLLARIRQSQGLLGAAARTMLHVCAATGFEPALCLRAATFARECDRHATAAEICAGALERGPVPPELLFLAGNVAREAGEFGKARDHYLAALEAGLDTDRHHVFFALANTRRYSDAADGELTEFARHLAERHRAPRARASAGFALAKAYDDLADYPAAAKVLRQANALGHAACPWSAEAWHGFIASRRRARVAPVAVEPDRAFTPVFIVGVPRSGTTLTATLLARVTGACDRGELRSLRFIADRLITGGYLADRAAVGEAAALYRRLAVQDDPPVRLYLDQDPLNFRYLDIAAAMFPQARIIHLRRDRRDTALSLWSQDFAHPDLAFAYDLGDIATFMQGHDALMQHWKRMPAIAIRGLDYESLVADPDAVLADLGEFIGASPAAASGPSAAAPIQSASVWQARQPVYTTSVGRWKRYLSHVPELGEFGQ